MENFEFYKLYCSYTRSEKREKIGNRNITLKSLIEIQICQENNYILDLYHNRCSNRTIITLNNKFLVNKRTILLHLLNIIKNITTC